MVTCKASCGEDGLALQIARIDDVIVNEGKAPNPGACEILQRGRANPAKPDDRYVLASERNLTRAADFGQHNMAGKTVEALWGQTHG